MNKNKINYTKLVLSKEELAKIAPLYRKRYIMFISMIRDLTLLSKFIHYTSNSCDTEAKESLLQYANTMASIFFLTTLISKIHEMWNFLRRNDIMEELQTSSLSPELKKSLDEINSFFLKNPNRSEEKTKENKLFEFIRNKFGFHYEYKDEIDPIINEAFDKFKDKEFEMYLTEVDSANDIFPSLNSVVFICLLKKMNSLAFPGDDQQKMRELFLLAAKGAGLFVNFCSLYLAERFKIKWESVKEVKIKAQDISKIKLPVIVVKNKES